MLSLQQTSRPSQSTSLPIPLTSLRLVAALPHPDTGVERDVIINALKLRRRNIAQLRGEDPPERVIAGVSPTIAIPYPEKEKKEEEEHDCDTLRIEVEDKTWTPTLTEPPMPPSIIDELRGKYSKFRTRHDEEWLEGKREEDRLAEDKKRWEKLAMRSPAQEAAGREKGRRKRMRKRNLVEGGDGKWRLREDIVESIGSVMEKKLGEEEVRRRLAGVDLEGPALEAQGGKEVELRA